MNIISVLRKVVEYVLSLFFERKCSGCGYKIKTPNGFSMVVWICILNARLAGTLSTWLMNM